MEHAPLPAFDLSRLKRNPVNMDLKKPDFLFPGWRVSTSSALSSIYRFDLQDKINSTSASNYGIKFKLTRKEHWAELTISWDSELSAWVLKSSIFFPYNDCVLSTEPEVVWKDLAKAAEIKVLSILSALAECKDFCIEDTSYGLVGSNASDWPASKIANHISYILRQPDNEDRLNA